jgi:ribonuclease R
MNDNIDYQQLLLDFIQRPNYQPVKLRVIAKKLDRVGEEKELKRALKRLIRQNKAAYGSKHLVRPLGAEKPGTQGEGSQSRLQTSESSNDVIGVFRRNPAGFGFVTPKASTATDRSDDIFIPHQKTLDAADLDLVRVRLSRGHRRGPGTRFETAKRSGRIVEVIERFTNRFVGTYTEHDGNGIVHIDGGVFETGILVGDARAKNCRVDDKVVIEMVRFPSLYQDGEAVIVEVLGERGKPGVDTLTVMRQFGLPEEFPADVLENARKQAGLFDDAKIPPERTDFTSKTVITIDPTTARDFDDAISLEKLDNGNWLLGVHIADVSYFVPRKSALDDEAFQRGTSVYLPDRVVPMLPEIISNNLASLQPHRVRYTTTALMELTEKGVPIHTELHRGAIKSAHRFTYEEIDDYLADRDAWREKLPPDVFELVGAMHRLAMKLRYRRMAAGAINLVLPEIRIDLDEEGKVCGAHTEENTESHQVIEEFMLAANIAVATWLAGQGLNLLRRVHAPPTETKISDLTSFIQGLGLSRESLQNRFELKRVVEQSENSPQQHAVHYAVLRSMQKAVYSPEDIGHFALNAEIYCHFTSPIRRYPDLVIHRMVSDLLEGKKPDSNFDRLAQTGKHCSNMEKRAVEAERELVKLKLLNFLSDKIGHQMHARITGVEAFGVFAQGVEIPAEGLIPLAKLPEDTYQFDRAARTLSGFRKTNQFRLGDLIEVEVAVVHPDRRILEFDLIGVDPAPRNIIRRGQRIDFESTTSRRSPNRSLEAQEKESGQPKSRSSRPVKSSLTDENRRQQMTRSKSSRRSADPDDAERNERRKQKPFRDRSQVGEEAARDDRKVPRKYASKKTDASKKSETSPERSSSRKKLAKPTRKASKKSTPASSKKKKFPKRATSSEKKPQPDHRQTRKSKPARNRKRKSSDKRK